MADPRIESLERMLEKGHISVDQYIRGLAALEQRKREETPATVVATPALRSAAQAQRARKNAKKREKKKKALAEQAAAPAALALEAELPERV